MEKIGKKLSGAALAVSLLVATLIAAAEDGGMNAGVGINVSNNNYYGGGYGYGISLPLRFTNFTIEPEITFYNSHTGSSVVTNPYANDYSFYQLETGIYLRKEVAPSVEIYYGGRVGYSEGRNSYNNSLSPSGNSSGNTRGYMVGPTFGAEYFFNPHFSAGLDVSLIYEQQKQSSTSGGTSGDYDFRQTSYQGRAKFRYYFKE